MQRRRLQGRWHRRRGFTLFEVLLVVMIVGVLAAMVVPNLLGRQKQAMIDTTMIRIKNLESVMRIYAVDHDGVFPDGGQDVLNTLTQQEEKNGTIREPYLEELPRDAWGEVLYYEYPNNKGGSTAKPAIWSSGPNRKNDSGSGDDVNNWTQTAG